MIPVPWPLVVIGIASLVAWAMAVALALGLCWMFARVEPQARVIREAEKIVRGR